MYNAYGLLANVISVVTFEEMVKVKLSIIPTLGRVDVSKSPIGQLRLR
jgi:hypothetical protein